MIKIRKAVIGILCFLLSFSIFEGCAYAVSNDYNSYNFSWEVYQKKTTSGRGTNRETTWNYYFDFDHQLVAYVKCRYNGYNYTYTYEFDIYKLVERDDGLLCIVDQNGEMSDVFFKFEGKIFKKLRACDSEGAFLPLTSTVDKDSVGRETKLHWSDRKIKEQPPMRLSFSGFYEQYPDPKHCLARLDKK